MSILVSIVIPTKNRSDSLPETLGSVMEQTYPHWEAIVVDDGSSDGTEELVMAIIAKEPRIRFLKRDRRPSGASVCRNIGASAAKGEYVIFLDSDDLLAPSCLAHRVKFMEENPDDDFAVFLTQVFHSTPGDCPYLINHPTEEDDLDRFLRQDVPWQTTGPIWKKNSLAEIGPWDERALSMQDWEFHVRALAAGLKYRKALEIDSYWRNTRPTSITHGAVWRSSRRIWNRIRLFSRIVVILRARGVMTRRRQRLLAMEYYRHAFIHNARRTLAFRAWTMARRERVIGWNTYAAIVVGDFVARCGRRINNFIVNRLIPELHLHRTHCHGSLSAINKK